MPSSVKAQAYLRHWPSACSVIRRWIIAIALSRLAGCGWVEVSGMPCRSKRACAIAPPADGEPVHCPASASISSENTGSDRGFSGGPAFARDWRALRHQLALPGERVAHDGVEIVELRRPAQHLADARGGGHNRDRIAGPARRHAHGKRMAHGAADRLNHFEY